MDPSELFIYLAIVCSKEKKHQQVAEHWRKNMKRLRAGLMKHLRQIQGIHMIMGVDQQTPSLICLPQEKLRLVYL